MRGENSNKKKIREGMGKETGITRNVPLTNERAGVMLIARSIIHCCQRSLSHLSLRLGAVHLKVGKNL